MAAGKWVESAQGLAEPIYFSDRQILFFAGGRYRPEEEHRPVSKALENPGAWQTFVLLTGDGLPAARARDWAQQNDLERVRSFGDGHREKVLVYSRR